MLDAARFQLQERWPFDQTIQLHRPDSKLAGAAFALLSQT